MLMDFNVRGQQGNELSHVYYLWIIVMFLSAVLSMILMAPIHCRGPIGEQVV